MIENILILDTETTGLDPSKGCKVIEVGAILFNVKYRQPIQMMSTLLSCEDNPVQKINHIDPLWTQVPKEELAAIKFLGYMTRDASFIVAHNAPFDEKFMKTIPVDLPFSEKRWICTQRDFKWPVQLFKYSLEAICHAMGVPYIHAHRALTDCMFLSLCFQKIPDLLERLEAAAQGQANNRFR